MKLIQWCGTWLHVAVTAVALTIGGRGFADVIYVKAGLLTGNHDGSSWTNAFRFLQDALAVAGAGDEVWVAAGVYYPDESTANPSGTGDRNATFSVPAGVSLYGHFNGNESAISQRPAFPSQGSTEPDPFETRLSGDVDRNDIEGTFINHDQNAYHVVSSPELGCQIDGFRVTAGNMVGAPSPVPEGSALRALGAIRLLNCLVNWNSGPYVVWCNAGDINSVILEGCNISNNGRGIAAVESVGGCTILHSTISEQISAGLVLWGASRIENSYIMHNTGHGIYARNSSQLAIVLINCLIAGNGSVGDSSAGIYLVTHYSVYLYGCTVSNNANGFIGGVTVCGSIVYGNIETEFTPFIDARYSCIGDDYSSPPSWNNISEDPQFADPTNDGFTLLPDSPARNRVPLDAACSANFGAYPQLDIDGVWRGIGGDNPPGEMGAYAFVDCSRDAQGTRVWRLPEDGSFDDCEKWNISPPTSQWPTIFDQAGSYVVSFNGDAAANSHTQVAGDVLFDLGGFDYTLTNESLPSMVVSAVGNAPSLNLLNGEMRGFTGRIADASASNGSVIVGGNGLLRFEQNLAIGFAGNGTLRVEDGGHAICRNASVGNLSSSQGQVVVTDPNSILDVPFFLEINRGNLDVSSGGLVRAGIPGLFPGIFLFDDGTITGDGTIQADVINFGTVIPADQLSPLSIEGNYVQVGQSPILGANSGRLLIDIDNRGLSTSLMVEGQASLGGGLLVNLAPGVTLPDTASLPVLAADSINSAEPTFDVAFLPGLDNNKFLRVDYPGNDADPFGPGSVNLTIADLTALLNYGQGSASLPGSLTALAVGDLNGDGFDDLAVTITNGDQSPGAVAILLNDPLNPGTYATNTQFPVGNDPVAITIARLDGNASPDLAIVNRNDGIAPGSVSILANDGTILAGFNPLGAPIPVGVGPVAIASANFDGIDTPAGQNVGDRDLVVANLGSGTVAIMSNNGAGQFASIQSLPAGAAAAIDPADVDNDRDIDLPVADAAGAVQLLIGDGGNPFTNGPVIPVGIGASQLLAEDLNGDGHPEIITANTLDGSLSVLVNDPIAPGQYAPAVNIPLDDPPHALVAANLDGAVAVIPGTDPPLPDADADLAVLMGSGLNARVIVLRNDTAAPIVPGVPQPLTLTQDLNEPCADFAIALQSGENIDGLAGFDLVTITSGGSCFTDGAAAGLQEIGLVFNASVPVKRPVVCAADIAPFVIGGNTGDGVVNVDDLLAVINAWGICPIDPNPCPPDIAPIPTGNNLVNVDDLLAVINAWGPCP